MKHIKNLAILSVLWAAAAVAAEPGTIEIYGKGTASAKPEQVEITVSVISLCYADAKAAKDANAVLANQVLAVLQTYRLGNQDKVIATGGPTQRQNEYVYDNGSSDRKLLCQLQWRATNDLTLTTSAMDRIADIQDDILKAIGSAQDIQAGVTAQTYATLSEPTFSLLPATTLKLRTQAQQQAWLDAKAQYDGFASMCAFKNPRLVSITPPQEFYPVPRYAAPSAKETGNTSTPVLPDEMQVEASWKFVWQFDPSTACADRL